MNKVKMKIDTLYNLIEEIEKEEKYLFVIYPDTYRVGIDVLDWEAEQEVDGGWFHSVQEALSFVSMFQEVMVCDFDPSGEICPTNCPCCGLEDRDQA